MPKLLSLLISLSLTLFAAGATAQLKVVATTADLASIAHEVGGERVEVTALALHTQDPHFVDARPHLALALARADLLLAVGLDLEVGWLRTLQVGSRNGKIQSGASGYLECSEFVRVLEVPKGQVDRSAGDVHPGGNPHYLYDPRQAARVAKGIAERMASLDPEHAAAYKKNAIAFIKRLGAATAAWNKKLKGARGAKVIAYHKSFPYLADWLGMTVLEHVEPKPGIPPNPHHVAHVMAVAKKAEVRVILQEAFYPSKVSEVIAERTGTQLVRIPAAPNFRGGQSYLAHMDAIVNSLGKVYSK